MAAVTHDSTARTSVPGLGLALLSAVSFGLSGALGRGLLDAGWSAGAAVTFRVLLAGVVLLPVAWVQLAGRWSLLRRNAPLVVGFGLLAVAGCQLAYFNAVAYLPVAVALLIEYIAPVGVVGWMWLRHGQRPSLLTVAGAFVAACGLVLVLDVLSGGGGFSLVGVLWALGACVGVGFYFVSSSHDDNGLPGIVLATSGLLLGGLVLSVAGLVGVVPMQVSGADVVFHGFTAPSWATAVVLGLVCAAVPYVAGISANRLLGSRLASFVGLLEVLASAVFAWLLLGQASHAVQVLGAVLVLAGVVAVKLGERQTVAVSPTVEPVAA